MIIWRTGHPVNETVTKAVAKGTRFPRKSTERFDNEFLYNPQPSIGYGILRGMNQIYWFCNKHNIDYWNIDRGFFGASHYDGYYRIGKNGIQPTYRELDLDDRRLKKFRIEIEPWKSNKDGYILVCPPTQFMEDYYQMQRNSWIVTGKR